MYTITKSDGKWAVVEAKVNSVECALISKEYGTAFGSGMPSAGEDFGLTKHAVGKYVDRVEAGTCLTWCDSFVDVSPDDTVVVACDSNEDLVRIGHTA